MGDDEPLNTDNFGDDDDDDDLEDNDSVFENDNNKIESPNLSPF